MCNVCAPALLTYPARPRSGGRFDLSLQAGAYQDIDAWDVEPKYNGWRAAVHCPTRTVFNRHGTRLSIGVPALILDRLQQMPFEWLDIEVLERRHAVGKGSVIVLDWIARDITRIPRRGLLGMFFLELGIGETPLEGSIYLTPSFPMSIGTEIYLRLKELNAHHGCTFYEGLVAKRHLSLYPHQTYSPDEEFKEWVKHRFTTA